jgi:hypothetical protein
MRKKHGNTSVRVAARTSQADTVQYKNNEQYNSEKKKPVKQRSNNVTDQYRTQNIQLLFK